MPTHSANLNLQTTVLRGFPIKSPESKKYKECEQWLKSNLGKQVEITDETIELYLAWFNENLATKKQDLLKKIFNFEVNAERIVIKNLERTKKVNLEWDSSSLRYSARGNHIQFPILNEYTSVMYY